jgi:hypothetical protein
LRTKEREWALKLTIKRRQNVTRSQKAGKVENFKGSSFSEVIAPGGKLRKYEQKNIKVFICIIKKNNLS